MMARIQGNPDYPFVVIPHPVTALTEEQLAERARLALPQVLRLLLGREYACSTFLHPPGYAILRPLLNA